MFSSRLEQWDGIFWSIINTSICLFLDTFTSGKGIYTKDFISNTYRLLFKSGKKKTYKKIRRGENKNLYIYVLFQTNIASLQYRK